MGGRGQRDDRAHGPAAARSDVQSLFDQICEKYRVAGIELRFGEPEDEPLQAILEQPHI